MVLRGEGTIPAQDLGPVLWDATCLGATSQRDPKGLRETAHDLPVLNVFSGGISDKISEALCTSGHSIPCTRGLCAEVLFSYVPEHL